MKVGIWRADTELRSGRELATAIAAYGLDQAGCVPDRRCAGGPRVPRRCQ